MNQLACLTRRTFLAGGTALAASACIGLFGCSNASDDNRTNDNAAEDEAAAPVDAYFENGVIYPVDDRDSLAEVLAVRDGSIVFVGSSADGRRYRDAARNVVDLQGRFVLPGMIEGHIHSGSPDFFDFSLVGLATAEDELAAVKAAVDGKPDKDTYFGYGFAAALFPGEELEKGPRKERLDEISPDKPVMIYSFDGHAAWLNSKAFEYLGITKDTEPTPGGDIPKDADGNLWGTLQDSAMSLAATFPIDQQNLSSALAQFLANLNSLGYTTIFTPPGNGFFPVPFDAYQALADQDELTMRVRGAGIVTSWQTDEDLAALDELRTKHDDDRLKVIAAKFFTDGVMDNESALLLEPYSDNPDSKGETGWKQDDLNRAVEAVNRTGLLAHLHAIGDGGVRMALDAIEHAEDRVENDHGRNAITHLQLVSEDDIPRFADLQVTAVVNPYWALKTPHYWDTKELPALGQRAERMYPLKSFVDTGALLASASDYPVTPHPNPFEAIQAGVTRNLVNGAEYEVENITDMNDPTYLLWPEERLDARQMVRSFTADAARALGLEDQAGTLEAGKSADFVVLDQNVFDIDPLSIKNTRVLETYLRGERVYFGEQ